MTLLLLTAFSVSCIHAPSKPTRPKSSVSSYRCSLVFILDDVLQMKTIPLPMEMQRALVNELGQRQIHLQLLEPQFNLNHDAGIRDTDRRLRHAAKLVPNASHVLLVETQARFFSQLSGRYRWSVYFKATLAQRNEDSRNMAAPLLTLGVKTFEQPVTLTYEHEKEIEAIGAAMPELARQTAYLMDSHL